MRCYNCFRPNEFCLCSFATPPIETGVKFIFLMHPKEAKRQRTGTGRLAHLCLADSEILQGLEFSQNARLCDLLGDERFLPVLMYPGSDALNVNDEHFRKLLLQEHSEKNPTRADESRAAQFSCTEKNASNTMCARKILMPIIIDATWFCSRKIIEHNEFLLRLTKLSFVNTYSSIFTFKHEPRPECVSTIETCYYLIKELQEAKIVAHTVNAEPLMAIFKKLISDQLRAENERVQGLRPSTHGYDWKYNKIREIPSF